MTTTAQASDTYFPARPSTDEAVRDLDHAHVFHSWSAQDEINPLPVASGSGASFTDYEGREFLDFGSQLVYVNLGHSHPRLIQAIKDQADTLPTIAPGFANDARAQLAAMIAQVAPGKSVDVNLVLTSTGYRRVKQQLFYLGTVVRVTATDAVGNAKTTDTNVRLS